MNILYLAHRFPFPPNKGDKLRAFRQIEYLARRHRIWCACFLDDRADRAHIPALRAHCHALGVIPLYQPLALLRGMTGLIRGGTLTEHYYASAQMRRLLRSWSMETNFDAVIAFSSSMAAYAKLVPATRRVLDLCDLDSAKWNDYAVNTRYPVKYFYRMEAKRLAQEEVDGIGTFDATTLITRREAALLPEASREKVHVISNGITSPMPSATIPARRAEFPVVGFLGQMNYRPNVDAVCWFARRVWPLIRTAHSQAVFRIAGRRPTRAVQRLASLPGVEVTGEIADAGAELACLDVFVAPLRLARGLPNKVLEAFAARRPVVTTSTVAECLQLAHGRECLVADHPEIMARAVQDLLTDADFAGTLARAGSEFVHRHHRWEVELARFEMLVLGATPPRKAPHERVSTNRDLVTEGPPAMNAKLTQKS